MQNRFIRLVTFAIACFFVAAALADDSDDDRPRARPPRAASKPAAKPPAKKAAAPKKFVDINSATKAELKKLPFIGDEEADRIIAGRPFLTKAHLVTKGFISPGAYEAIKNDIIARQDSKPKK